MSEKDKGTVVEGRHDADEETNLERRNSYHI